MATTWAVEMANSARTRMHELSRNARIDIVEPQVIYDRDRWLCQICFRPISKNLVNPFDLNRATIDHRIPIALGGSHTFSNLQSAHLSCNSSKGSRPQSPS